MSAREFVWRQSESHHVPLPGKLPSVFFPALVYLLTPIKWIDYSISLIIKWEKMCGWKPN